MLSAHRLLFLAQLCGIPLAVALTSGAAYAQNDPQGPDTRPGRIRLGPLYVTPSIALRNVGFDRNVFNAATDRRSDFVTTFETQADATLRMRRLQLTAVGTANYEYFANVSSERSLNGDISLKGGLALRRFLIVTDSRFSNTRQRLNFELDVRARRIDNVYRLGLRTLLSPRTTIETGFGKQVVEFNSGSQFLGTSLREALNRDSNAIYVAGYHVLTPLTTLSLVTETLDDRFPFAPVRDNRSVRVLPGVEFKPRALLSGSAQVGYRRLSPLSPTVPAYSGLAANVSLTYGTLRGTALTAVFSQDVEYSYEPALPYFVARRLGATARRRIGLRLDVTGSLTSHRHSYRSLLGVPVVAGSKARDHIWTVQSSVGYNSGRSSRVSLDFSYDRRRSNRSDLFRYETLRIFASARHRF